MELTVETAPAQTTTDSEPRSRCSVCDHELTAHDAIGLRFCHATQANALSRHCICRGAA